MTGVKYGTWYLHTLINLRSRRRAIPSLQHERDQRLFLTPVLTPSDARRQLLGLTTTFDAMVSKPTSEA